MLGFTILPDQYLDAAYLGQLDIVQQYIRENINNIDAINYQNANGNHALTLAVIWNREAIVRALLAVPGINVNVRGFTQCTPLIWAADNGHTDIVQALLAMPDIDVNAEDANGMTAMSVAIAKNHQDTVRALLRAEDIDLVRAEEEGASHRSLEINRLIMDAIAARIEWEEDAREFTPSQEFLQAARDGDVAGIQRYVLANRANQDAINVRDPVTGNTALILAAIRGHRNVVNELLYASAIDIAAVNHANHTAATEAELSGQDDIATQLTLLITSRTQEESTKPIVPITPVTRPNRPRNFEERLEDIKFDGKIPDHLICPITQRIMNDPITIASGITYDRDALRQYFLSQGNPPTIKCPTTNIIIKISELNNASSYTIKYLLEKFVSKQEIKNSQRVKVEVPAAANGENTREARLLFFNRGRQVQEESVGYLKGLRK